MHRARLLCRIFSIALIAPACGDGDASARDGAADAPGADAGADVGPSPATRGFALASTGLQARAGESRLYHLTSADLATDVDVVAVHQDFYGVPWDAFAAGEAPPAAWASVMQALADDARGTGKPVFLAVALAGGPGRAFLADHAHEEAGALRVDAGWTSRCFDFASEPRGPALRAAYVRYLEWMTERFEPAYFNVAIELNLYATACGTRGWDALVDVHNEGYAAVKAMRPDTIVFPSIVLEQLYGVAADACPPPRTPSECYAANLEGLAGLERDRLAISTYPYGVPGIERVADVPADWFTRAPQRTGDRLVVAETGWTSRDLTAFDGAGCPAFRTSTPAEQLAYFERLVGEARGADMDLVTWWSNRDVVPAEVMEECPCSTRPPWCAVIDAFRTAIGGSDPAAQYVGEIVFKFWGSMGLREYDGTPKAAFMARWNDVRALPLE